MLDELFPCPFHRVFPVLLFYVKEKNLKYREIELLGLKLKTND